MLRSHPRLAGAAQISFACVCVGAGLAWAFTGCEGWDPRSPFEHNSSEVDQALVELGRGKLEPAERTLEALLNTGRCGADAGLLLSSDVRKLPNASFDLGIVLFGLAERYGRRFGEEDLDAGPNAEQLARGRSVEVACGLIVVEAIAADPTVPLELRARARYLAGNLEFLSRRYQNAVTEYDEALTLAPGPPVESGVDAIGGDAAWNRAIALRRIDDPHDAGTDASDGSNSADSSDSTDGSSKPDSGSSGSDGGESADSGASQPDSGGAHDAGDSDEGGQAGTDSGQPEPQDKKPAAPLPQQDTKMLDSLEQAPSYQGQEAKQRARTRHHSAMEDK